MSEFMTAMADFFNGSSIWVYAFIFLGKISEVTLATLRYVLIGRGERMIGSVVGIFEITLWLIVTSSVLAGFQDDFIKVVVFIVAFAVGNYTGSLLEEMLALGLCSLQAVLTDEKTMTLAAAALREKGFGVTAVEAKGKEDTDRYMLLMTLKRRLVNEAMETLRAVCPDPVITVSNVATQKGGYMRQTSVPRRRLFK